jgi:hypothetical protein
VGNSQLCIEFNMVLEASSPSLTPLSDVLAYLSAGEFPEGRPITPTTCKNLDQTHAKHDATRLTYTLARCKHYPDIRKVGSFVGLAHQKKLHACGVTRQSRPAFYHSLSRVTSTALRREIR